MPEQRPKSERRMFLLKLKCGIQVFKWSKVVWFANDLVFEWHLNIIQKSPVFEWLGCVITIIKLQIAILMYYHLKTGH